MHTRTLLRPLALFALLLPVALVHAQRGTLEPVEVVFTPDMDKAALERVQEEVKAKGIELAYTNKRFEAGRLLHIGFIVKTTDGSAKAEGDIKLEQRFGFRVDPTPHAKARIEVGSLDAKPGSRPTPAPER